MPSLFHVPCESGFPLPVWGRPVLSEAEGRRKQGEGAVSRAEIVVSPSLASILPCLAQQIFSSEDNLTGGLLSQDNTGFTEGRT
jgi:hypothetical protein